MNEMGVDSKILKRNTEKVDYCMLLSLLRKEKNVNVQHTMTVKRAIMLADNKEKACRIRPEALTR